MFDTIKQMLGMGPAANFTALIERDAQIIDVRTVDEFQGGHIRGSVNIPLQSLDRHLSKINKDKPVITCCASGMRSAAAKRLLESKGYSEVVNGGGWAGLQMRLRK